MDQVKLMFLINNQKVMCLIINE